MNDDEKVQLIQDHFTSFWQGDVAAIDRQLSADFVDAAAPAGTLPGTENVKTASLGARTGFPDMTVAVDDALVVGDTVAVKATWRGTNTGPMMGMEPTGKTVVVSGMVVWDLDDQGRITHRCEHLDKREFMKQLGVDIP